MEHYIEKAQKHLQNQQLSVFRLDGTLRNSAEQRSCIISIILLGGTIMKSEANRGRKKAPARGRGDWLTPDNLFVDDFEGRFQGRDCCADVKVGAFRLLACFDERRNVFRDAGAQFSRNPLGFGLGERVPDNP